MDCVDRFGSFELDHEARTLRLDGRCVTVKAGQEWAALVLLVSKFGKVVTFAELAKTIGPHNRRHDAHALISRIRAIIDLDPRLHLPSVRNLGYRLEDKREQSTPVEQEAARLAPEMSTMYRDNYRDVIHELKPIYSLNEARLIALSKEEAGQIRGLLDRKQISAQVFETVQPLDMFRLAYKLRYQHAFLAKKLDRRLTRATGWLGNAVLVQCICLDDKDRKRAVEAIQESRSLDGTPTPGRGQISLEIRVDPWSAPLALGHNGFSEDHIDCFRVQLTTVKALQDTLARKQFPAKMSDPDLKAPIKDKGAIASYARSAFGATAFEHSAAMLEPWTDPRRDPVCSPLWLSHIFDSASWAGMSTIGELDEVARSGFGLAREYRRSPEGESAFAPGDVTDLLSSALVFASASFLRTYPSSPQAELFRTQHCAEREPGPAI